MSRGPSQGEALAPGRSGRSSRWSSSSRTAGSIRRRTTSSATGSPAGLSRALTLVNFPIALVAIALVLIAVAALPPRAWWAAAPAIALCADDPLVRRPGRPRRALGQRDPCARRGDRALGLTVAATRRAGASFAPRRPWDGWRDRRRRRRRARLAAVDQRRARLPLPGRRLHGRGARSSRRTARRSRRCTSATTTGRTARCSCSRAAALARRVEPPGALRSRRSPTSGRCSRTAA